MKKYVKKHESETAAKGHVENIKKRGGVAIMAKIGKSYGVEYYFPTEEPPISKEQHEKLKREILKNKAGLNSGAIDPFNFMAMLDKKYFPQSKERGKKHAGIYDAHTEYLNSMFEELEINMD